jgi:hypothetical protein
MPWLANCHADSAERGAAAEPTTTMRVSWV